MRPLVSLANTSMCPASHDNAAVPDRNVTPDGDPNRSHPDTGTHPNPSW